jgi:hypothetical protein
MPWDSLSLHFTFAVIADVAVRVCIQVSRFAFGMLSEYRYFRFPKSLWTRCCSLLSARSRADQGQMKL